MGSDYNLLYRSIYSSCQVLFCIFNRNVEFKLEYASKPRKKIVLCTPKKSVEIFKPSIWLSPPPPAETFEQPNDLRKLIQQLWNQEVSKDHHKRKYIGHTKNVVPETFNIDLKKQNRKMKKITD